MSSRDLFFRRDAADGWGPATEAPRADGAPAVLVAASPALAVEVAAAGTALLLAAAPDVAAGAVVEPPRLPNNAGAGAEDVVDVDVEGAEEAAPLGPPNKVGARAEVAGADEVADVAAEDEDGA